MSSPRLVTIVCAKAPRTQHVAAVRHPVWFGRFPDEWICSFCGARVKVAW